jgi:hypothetical protein
MYAVEQEPPSKAFQEAWQHAGRHIQSMAREGINWFRATLHTPMAEHLSFRLGNQIFFVFVETPDTPFVGNPKSLFLDVSQEAQAIPCVMRVKKKLLGGYDIVSAGWGFTHAITGENVNPSDLVSDALIEMTDWELHDFAIQLVAQYIDKNGPKVFSKQPSRHIDPSIWFEDENGKHWVVVRADRYPKKQAEKPDAMQAIKESCAHMSLSGFFASVCVANHNDQFDGKTTLPLYRGHGMHANFTGLEVV